MASTIDLSYHYKTRRTDFGRPTNILEETNARLFLSIEPDPELRSKYEAINPFGIGIQASIPYSCHSVNTEITKIESKDVYHKEGGWPQGVDSTNATSCKQTRQKFEKRDGYVSKLRDMSITAENTVKLNQSIDLYSDHFSTSDKTTTVIDPQIKTINIFRDRFPSRQISTISWSSDKRIAICYTPTDLSSSSTHYESFIYNLECPSLPEYELHPSSPITCLEYNSKDNNILVSGMSHGTLCLWDLRQGSLPIWTSAIEKSHRDIVNSVKWINSKTAFECVSVSSDGTTMTWDTRSTYEPLETITLLPSQEMIPKGYQGPFGGRCIDYHTGVPTKYMVGTIEGLVLTINRKSSDPNNRISNIFPGHYGPIYSVCRHPIETKYFCTISDWSCKFYTEDNKTPLINLPSHPNYLTNAIWGLSRTTVIYIANKSGKIEAWDLIQSLKEPICSISVGNYPIYAMRMDNLGNMLMVGDSNGTATLLEVNEPLRNITNMEKSLFNGMMSRESKRVKNYDQFLKEQKMREKARASAIQEDALKKQEKQFDKEQIEKEFEAALNGEAEVVVEKKRIVIGAEDEEQQIDDNEQKLNVKVERNDEEEQQKVRERGEINNEEEENEQKLKVKIEKQQNDNDENEQKLKIKIEKNDDDDKENKSSQGNEEEEQVKERKLSSRSQKSEEQQKLSIKLEKHEEDESEHKHSARSGRHNEEEDRSSGRRSSARSGRHNEEEEISSGRRLEIKMVNNEEEEHHSDKSNTKTRELNNEEESSGRNSSRSQKSEQKLSIKLEKHEEDESEHKHSARSDKHNEEEEISSGRRLQIKVVEKENESEHEQSARSGRHSEEEESSGRRLKIKMVNNEEEEERSGRNSSRSQKSEQKLSIKVERHEEDESEHKHSTRSDNHSEEEEISSGKRLKIKLEKDGESEPKHSARSGKQNEEEEQYSGRRSSARSGKHEEEEEESEHKNSARSDKHNEEEEISSGRRLKIKLEKDGESEPKHSARSQKNEEEERSSGRRSSARSQKNEEEEQSSGSTNSSRSRKHNEEEQSSGRRSSSRSDPKLKLEIEREEANSNDSNDFIDE
ncbi:axonemal outer arm dynein intermediate chain 1 [Histomonas meleagridis]|uniref:axonemal outer arm dynein intermediate chain 1 n=1 Tax=Histomonas meleagridis TaxID=135588 RepID=UPI00355AC81A|nr:axonemal outer arm dynein intermediate chain 1 [Histomonas meleagridis]KAH0805178.1 axonemal outer arm dynein intermediate chain 1 [Histomonas meleagridis]